MKTTGKILLVGIRDDKGQIDHIKAFKNPKWANKYAMSAGEFAAFSEVDVEFFTVPTKGFSSAGSSST